MERVPQPATVNAYLELDRGSDARLEYRGGRIVALAVPSARHEFVVQNVVRLLGAAIRKRGCIYGTGAAKVVTPGGSRAIPDFVASCDPDDIANAGSDGEFILRNPWLVVEVLSAATEADDRGEKLDDYQTIPVLTHYVLLDSRRRNMTLYVRESSGERGFGHLARLRAIELPRLGTTLGIEDVYLGTGVPDIAAAG